MTTPDLDQLLAGCGVLPRLPPERIAGGWIVRCIVMEASARAGALSDAIVALGTHGITCAITLDDVVRGWGPCTATLTEAGQ